MGTTLVEKLTKMLADQAELKCFDTNKQKFVDLPHANFLDTDVYLPSLYEFEGGYRSPVVVVLTSRPTVYGKTLGVSTGHVQINRDAILNAESDNPEWLYQGSWCASCGEDVVAWLPAPKFHDGKNTMVTVANSKVGDYLEYRTLD